MNFFVYIIKSDKNRHYIGMTSNLEDRINKHNRRHKGFTGTTEVWRLVISKSCKTKEEALKLERYLKSLKNSKKAVEYLEKLKS